MSSSNSFSLEDNERVYRLGWSPSLVLLQYGKQFNIHRQMHQSYLSRHKAEDFKPMQTQEARTLVQNLLDSTPDKYDKSVSRYVLVSSYFTDGHQLSF